MDDQDPYLLDVEMLLYDYVECYSLPQKVKVTEGFCNPNVEFSTGDVLDLHSLSCNEVKISYFHKNKPRDINYVTVSKDHPATFNVIPMGKSSMNHVEPRKDNLIFNGITELAKYCPLYVSVIKSYQEPGRVSLEVHDRLRLLRFVRRFGDRYLECKSIKRNKLVELNVLDPNGVFQEVQMTEYYTLSHLVNVLSRPRRIKVSSDVQNQRNPIQGLPSGEGYVFTLQQPEWLVNISPSDSPGSQYNVPAITDITVSPRQETYSSKLDSGIYLDQFVEDNMKDFPVVVHITDWEELGTTLENHSIRPGINMILCQPVEILKYVGKTKSGQMFAIPENYSCAIKKLPNEYDCIGELDRRVGFRFKSNITCSLRDWDEKEYGAKKDTVYEILQSDQPVINITDHGATLKQMVLEVKVVSAKDTGVAQYVSLPYDMCGEFVEVLQRDQSIQNGLSCLQSSPLPQMVEFIDGETSNQLLVDPLPMNTAIKLEACVADESILVMVEDRIPKETFPLSNQTRIVLSKRDSVMQCDIAGAKPSELTYCPEELSAERYHYLLSLVSYEEFPQIPQMRLFDSDHSDYEELPEHHIDLPPKLPAKDKGHKTAAVKYKKPPPMPQPDPGHLGPPVRPPKQHSSRGMRKVNKVNKLPPARNLPPLPQPANGARQLPPLPVDNHAGIGRDPPPVLPRKSQALQPGAAISPKHRPPSPLFERVPAPDPDSPDSDMELSDDDYEVQEGIPGLNPKKFKIPDNGNLRPFSITEMAQFFKLNNVSHEIVYRCRCDAINGEKFAALNKQKLAEYGLGAYPIIVHFHKMSQA